MTTHKKHIHIILASKKYISTPVILKDFIIHRSWRCVNCGKEVWIGLYFDGHFLCEKCQPSAAYIIYKLKKRIKVLLLKARTK